MRTPPAHVSPAVLQWARETAGLTPAALAEGIGQSEERVLAWENGSDQPSMAQLRDIAAKLKRPTATFFLPRPPEGPQKRRVDFRSLPAQLSSPGSPALEVELRLARLKRNDALQLADDLEVDLPQFRLEASQNEEAEQVGARIRDVLQVPAPGHRVWRDKYSALRTWKEAAERQGVLVMQVSGVSVAEMRGCAIAEFPLPIVLINSADSPAARTFTLIHELTHLALRQDSLCDLAEGEPFQSKAVERLEVFCNHVAGSALVPMDSLVTSSQVIENRRLGADGIWPDTALTHLARTFGTSTEVVLRRLVIAGEASTDFYVAWRAQQQRVQSSLNEDSGPVEYFRRVLNHNGRLFTRLVLDAYQREIITGTELSRMLGTKLSHLPKIENEVLRSELIA